MTAARASLDPDHLANAMDAMRRRMRFIAGFRAFAILALLAVIANVGLQIASDRAVAIETAPLAGSSEGERIVNPRFSGRDREGAPFVLTAQAASRPSGSASSATELERPTLSYALLSAEGADPSQVLAERGLYDRLARTLRLESDVRLSTRSGYVFQTSAATLHLEEGRVSGDRLVSGQAPWGLLRAGGFEVRENGERVRFTDGVQTRFYLEDAAGLSGADGEEP